MLEDKNIACFVHEGKCTLKSIHMSFLHLFSLYVGVHKREGEGKRLSDSSKDNPCSIHCLECWLSVCKIFIYLKHFMLPFHPIRGPNVSNTNILNYSYKI